MIDQFFILATAGHIDHGKSALVQALTGINPDRLPEEKKRGITIDLGFAHLDLPAQNDANKIFRVGIVDVPGHEDFIKNMVAGVGAVDVALFVVAADDGWMPQSEEHLQILDYLAVRFGVIALTKIDLVTSQRIVETSDAIRHHLAGSSLHGAPIVPVSSIKHIGLEPLRATLARVLAHVPSAHDIGKPRLPIDRVFALRGVGTVVTGTLSGGSLGRGQNVVVQPSGRTTRVRSVQSYRREVEAGQPGSRVALNLPDLSADVAEPGALRRGHVVTLASLGGSSDTLDAQLVRSARVGSTGPLLKSGSGVRIHLGSGSYAARVFLLDRATLPPAERDIAQVRLDTPIFAFAGDRFIVRDASGRTTLAGGTVLEPATSRRGWRAATRRTLLQRRAEASDNVVVFLATQLTRDRVALRESLLVQSRFSAAEIAAALREMHANNQIFLNSTLAADGPWWRTQRECAAALIDTAHRQHPERAGLPLLELQHALTKAWRSPVRWTNALIADMQATQGFTVNHTVIRRADHHPALPTNLQAAAARVRAALMEKPLEPASRAVLAPDALTQSALRFLVQAGEAVELTAEVVLSAASFVRMRAAVLRHLQAHGASTTSELRQALGTTRRILVPFLERLDREGVTRRQGDLRMLPKTGDKRTI